MKCTIISLILFLVITAEAKHFEKGYIVRDGVKSDGFIYFHPNKKEGSIIFFKENLTQGSTELKADQVTEFYLYDHKARFLSVTDSESGKIIFAEVKVSGEATLSSVYDFYILTNKSENVQFRLPIRKMVFKDKAEFADLKLVEIKKIGLIKNLLKDCPDAKIETKLQFLNEESVALAVMRFNQCKGVESVRTKSRISTGVILGYGTSSLTIDAAPSSPLGYFEAQPTLRYGLYFDFMPGRYLAKSVLNVQIVMMENTFKVKSNFPSAFGKTSIDNLTVRMPISMKLYLSPGQNGFFINPGISPNLVVHSDTRSYTNPIVPDLKFVELNSFVPTIFLGAGYEMPLLGKTKLVSSLRYEKTVFSPIKDYDSTMGYLQLDVAVKF